MSERFAPPLPTGTGVGGEGRGEGRGQILILFAIALAGLLAMFFFVVDVGRLFMAKQTLESIAALAADAGASYAQDWAVARFEWQTNYASAPTDAVNAFTPADRAALAADGLTGVADNARNVAYRVLSVNLAAYPSLFAPESLTAIIEVPFTNSQWPPEDFGVRVRVTARMPLAFGSAVFGPSLPLTAESVSRVTIAPCGDPCLNQPDGARRPTYPAEIALPLQNPDFEEGFQRVQAQELNVAIGWLAWFVDDGFNLRPEYKDATHPYDNRIFNGDHAQQFFRTFSPLDAGIQQTVPVPFKGRVRFSIQAQAWSTSTGNPDLSEGDGKLTVQIGIDPTGGSNPFSPNVIWGEPVYAYDSYAPLSVQVFTSSVAVTVYTRGKALLGVRNNDVYFDNARLVMTLPRYANTHASIEQPISPLDKPTATLPSPTTSSAPEPTLVPGQMTSTPRPLTVTPTVPASPTAEGPALTTTPSRLPLYLLAGVLALAALSLAFSLSRRR